MERMRKPELVESVKVHRRETWKHEEFAATDSRIYIKEYRSSPLEFDVSIMKKVSREAEEEQDIFRTISSLGLVISSIDEAPIRLNALVVENVFGN